MQSQILSQTVTDSVKFHPETARKIALDLARLDYLESIVPKKDSIIFNLYTLDSVRVDRIEDYKIEVSDVTATKNKALKRLKRTRKISFTVVVVAVIEAFVLVLK